MTTQNVYRVEIGDNMLVENVVARTLEEAIRKSRQYAKEYGLLKKDQKITSCEHVLSVQV